MQLMMGDAAQRVAHCESFEHCLLPSARRRSSNITNQGKHKRSRSTSRGSPGSSKSHRFQNEGIPEAMDRTGITSTTCDLSIFITLTEVA